MKRLLLVLALVSTVLTFGQTSIDLSGMTEDLRLGQNCSASQSPQEYVTTGDLNLNGFELDLRNVNLTVTGNLNGAGKIVGCGQAVLYVQGSIQNNPDIEDGLLGSTLSNTEFTTKDSFSFNGITKIVTIKNSAFIKVYDLAGRTVLSTLEDTLDFSTLKCGIYVFASDKFAKKIYVN